MPDPAIATCETPEEFEVLYRKKREKVFFGGRAGLKSWQYARALLTQGAQRELRVLCGREVQKSIKQSVHALLKRQIRSLQLEEHYDITDVAIHGRFTGTEFFFSGLGDPDQLKSFEGLSHVWVEEGQGVSENTWSSLLPTVRDAGSEVWVSMNPRLASDATYKRFVVPYKKFNLRAGHENDWTYVRHIGWQNNPWMTRELHMERRRDMQQRPKLYRHIWEGECRGALDNTLISAELTQLGVQRAYRPDEYAGSPIVIGVDVARYGSDRSRITVRQGLVIMERAKFDNISNTNLAGEVAQRIDKYKPDAVFVDAGRGEGVIDRLRQLRYQVIEVPFGGKPLNPKYADKRTEMWDLVKEWLEQGGSIPDDTELAEDLQAPWYDWGNRAGLMQLASKEDIRDGKPAQGIPGLGRSPDDGDALALTFAYPVAGRRGPVHGVPDKYTNNVESDYDPFEQAGY